MHILIIASLFPPDTPGGAEIVAGEVYEGLKHRGHQVSVLTSNPRGHLRRQHENIYPVFKTWSLQASEIRTWWKQIVYSLWNRQAAEKMVRRLNPDMVLVLGVYGLGAMVLDWLHRQSRIVIHYVISEAELRCYQMDAWFGRLQITKGRGLRSRLKRVLFKLLEFVLEKNPAPLNLQKSFFQSSYLKCKAAERGIPVNGAPIIHHGLKPEMIAHCTSSSFEGIVFSSRLSFEKGLHIFLEALELLSTRATFKNRKISIIGSFLEPTYETLIRNLAQRIRTSFQIEWPGHLPREKALEKLRRHKIFVFPAVFEEPYGLAPLEAMAAGLAVIATGTGGSAEYLNDGENCMIVPQDNPMALANALERLSADPALMTRLGQNGIRTARQFDLETCLDQIDAHLRSVCRQ